MNGPSIHIVVLNWNGLDDTLECLASLERMTYQNVRTIVVDNASRENEADSIEKAFPATVVLRRSENLGFCGGSNLGIKYALDHNADYVMLLNNDTLVPPELIGKLLNGIEHLEKVGAVSPLVLRYPEIDKVWFARAEWMPEQASFSLNPEMRSAEDLQNCDPYLSMFASGCCLMAPSEVFRKQGLLDERYFAYYDEAEWCARIRRNGYESYVVPSAVIYHKISRSTPELVALYLSSRNRILWMKENLLFHTRARSFGYLISEIVEHLRNLVAATEQQTSKAQSRAILLGYRDYFLRRFHKWDERTEKIIFP